MFYMYHLLPLLQKFTRVTTPTDLLILAIMHVYFFGRAIPRHFSCSNKLLIVGLQRGNTILGTCHTVSKSLYRVGIGNILTGGVYRYAIASCACCWQLDTRPHGWKWPGEYIICVVTKNYLENMVGNCNMIISVKINYSYNL